ncbi:hypothetical protein [Sphingopyxis sp. NJF-3]
MIVKLPQANLLSAKPPFTIINSLSCHLAIIKSDHRQRSGGGGFANSISSGGFPPSDLDLSAIFPLVGPANAAIARYEDVLAGTPAIFMFSELLNIAEGRKIV